MNKLPKTRNNDFVVQETANELLLYDLISNRAFCLNETAAIIFNACNGETSFAEINQKHDFTDELILLTLDGLKKENLLDEKFVSPFDRVKRREAIRKIGLATMITLPLISSVIAPTAVNAQSLGAGALYSVCSSPIDCGAGAPNCIDIESGSQFGSQRCCINSFASTRGGTNATFSNSAALCEDCLRGIQPQCCSNSFSSSNCNLGPGFFGPVCIGVCS